MGYYTKFNLIQPTNWTKEMKLALVKIQPGYFPTTNNVDDWLNDDFEDCKWYDHMDNMTKLSERFPETLFEVQCRGEDNEEWKNYFLNGKSTLCSSVVIFEEFDPINLK